MPLKAPKPLRILKIAGNTVCIQNVKSANAARVGRVGHSVKLAVFHFVELRGINFLPLKEGEDL